MPKGQKRTKIEEGKTVVLSFTAQEREAVNAKLDRLYDLQPHLSLGEALKLAVEPGLDVVHEQTMATMARAWEAVQAKAKATTVKVKGNK